MNAPLLSICISTRNRGSFLGATIESIISQLTETTELLIVDGASTDNTQSIVERYQIQCPALQYHHLETNGGFDHDYCVAVARANGEYCWLMTDDDLLKPGAVSAVLNAIQQNHDLIIVNAEVRSTDLASILEPTRLTNRTDKVYPPAAFEDMLADTGLYLSFIGAVVIRRTLWLQREQQHYWGSYFIHMGVIFQTPLPGTTLAIAEPFIEIRYGNAMWTPRALEIWMIKWRDLIWSFPVSDDVKRKLAPTNSMRDLKELLLYRANGVFLPQYYQTLMDTRRSFGANFRVMAKLILRLPIYPLNLLLTAIYSTLKGKQRQIILVDLANARRHLRKSSPV